MGVDAEVEVMIDRPVPKGPLARNTDKGVSAYTKNASAFGETQGVRHREVRTSEGLKISFTWVKEAISYRLSANIKSTLTHRRRKPLPAYGPRLLLKRPGGTKTGRRWARGFYRYSAWRKSPLGTFGRIRRPVTVPPANSRSGYRLRRVGRILYVTLTPFYICSDCFEYAIQIRADFGI